VSIRGSLCAVVAGAGVLATGACGATTGSAPPAASISPAPSVAPAPPRPSFADLTRGDSTSVVKLYAYDAEAHSAVVEPIIFMDGPAYCRKFQIKAGDGRCEREWITEESHTRITVPVVARPRLTAWENEKGEDCIGSMTTGGLCPVPAKVFARWLEENAEGMAVVTMKDGVVTKLAEMYTP